MSPGSSKDGRVRDNSQRATVQVSDQVSGLLHRHKDVLQEALPSGSIPEVVRNDLRALALNPADILLMLKEPSCRRALSVVLDIPQLVKADLSLEDLRREFSDPRAPEAARLIQACKLFFSTAETSSVGAILLKSTLYPALSEGDDLECLTQVVGLMRRQLEVPLSENDNCLHPAFENWNWNASKVLLWSYGTFSSCVDFGAYMKAAQLGAGCFGSLEDSGDYQQAVRVLREFIPERSSDADTLYSQPVPIRFKEGFNYEGLGRVLREFPIQEQLLPWMREMLAQVRRGFQGCSTRCLEYREERADKPWESDEYFHDKQALVREDFDFATDTLADVCGFFAIAVEHAFEGRTERSERSLRTNLQDLLGNDIAGTVRDFCAVLSEPSFNFPCTTRLARVLEELLREKLDLPLDIETELSDRLDQESVYQGCMLTAFRNKVVAGDLESALNIRMLFPWSGEAGTRRDTIDQYIDDHQPEIVVGVITASRGITAERNEKPDSQSTVDTFLRGILHFIRPELIRSEGNDLAKDLAGVVRSLVASDMIEGMPEMTTHRGCLQAGLLLHRIRRNPEFREKVAAEVLTTDTKKLLSTIAGFISRFNHDEQFGAYAGPVEAIYDACINFREELPVPKTRHLSAVKAMQGFIVAAIKKWRSGLNDTSVVDQSDLARVGLFIDPSIPTKAAKHSKSRRAFGGTQSTSRQGHAGNVLAQWENYVVETDSSIARGAYGVHAKYLVDKANGILRNVDSAEFDPKLFQGTFAELFVGVLRCWNELTEQDRRGMADCAGRMLGCEKGRLLCSQGLLRRSVVNVFEGVARTSENKNAANGKTPFATKSVRDLLSHWGFDSKTGEA